MKRLSVILLLFIPSLIFSQANKEIKAVRINQPISIDGVLDEMEWQNASIATDFTQTEPVAGAKPSQKTEVRILYDDDAIYIGATLYEVAFDSVTQTLSQRDDEGNADYFGVTFDTYGKGTIGFSYYVTSAGVQIDELLGINSADRTWDAVWYSEVSVHNDKWVAEFKIPFSAIRFPNQEIQNWKVNFTRIIRRKREESNWNYYDPAKLNFLSQFGKLNGIENIKAPLRLSFFPYISGYIENSQNGNAYSINGGMDVKYGINDAFTVDLTLIPDFGQVQFDNQVLNLSPFEVQFNEYRQFFTEGTDLFSKGGLFYTRRIGGRPINFNSVYDDLDSNEIVVDNPQIEQLINGTKFSGRTKKGLGIGVFNGITLASDAKIENIETGEIRTVQTNPLTNYNVTVVDQNLKYNSSITAINTNVWRSGHTYDANVSALEMNLFNKKEKYNLFLNGTLSQRYFEDETNLGFKYNLSTSKVSGNFQTSLQYNVADENYNPNDLGILFRNNYEQYIAIFNYNTYKPFWRIFRTWNSLEFYYFKLYNPSTFTSFTINYSGGASFKNYLWAGINASILPFNSYDYFEPRVQGRYYTLSGLTSFGGFISSDYSKPFALDVNLNYGERREPGRNEVSVRISPRFRFSDKFMLIYSTDYYQMNNDEGVGLTTDFRVQYDGENPIFGRRDRTTIENVISANYIFTNRMGLTFRLRHYWSKVNYKTFHALTEQGTLGFTEYTGFTPENISLHNNNYNAFTIDMVYSWVFQPGSQLSLVWKNSIFSFDGEVEKNYFQNTEGLLGFPATNSLSFRLLYFIDYLKIKEMTNRS